MAGFRIEGDTSANVAEVDSSKQLKITPTRDPELAGYIALAGLNDTGTITGEPEARHIRVSENNRIAAGLDSVFFNDTFNYTAQNSSNYLNPATTQTITYSAGYTILNGSSITTINTNSATRTYRSFPIFGQFELKCSMSCLHTIVPQTNAVTEWGLFSATLPGGAAPLDGAYFRFTSAGTFRAVINYNGTETTSGDLPIPTEAENHEYKIFMDEEHVEFWVDDVMNYDVDTPAGQGQPVMSATQPFTARHYIAGSAPALAMQFKISDVDINLGDMNTTKPWPHVMCGMGLSAYQGQNGGTMGSSALYTNSLAAGAGAAMTNTTAALGTGLGGQFTTQPTLAAGTDGILCSFQNPAGSTTITARTLAITGVKIQGMVTAAFTGGPVLYAYSLAYGHTAVSMATAEAATAKAPRRIALGWENYVVTAAVGAQGQGVYVTFDSPITVNNGEFIAIVAKNLGTVTSAGTITFLVTFDGYYE